MDFFWITFIERGIQLKAQTAAEGYVVSLIDLKHIQPTFKITRH